MKKVWNYIVNHNVWNKVVGTLIAASIIAFVTFLYSSIKSISFFSTLKSIFTFQLSIGIYLLITLTLLIIVKLVKRPSKSTAIKKEQVNINNYAEERMGGVKPVEKPIKISQNLIFDSNIVDEKTFTGYGQQVWDAPTRKLVGVVGSGVFEFKDKILTVNRSNREGRFIIPLTKYFFQREMVSFIPKYIYGKSPRNFRVTYLSRSISGIHRLIFVFRKKDGYDWINSTTIIIQERAWTNQTASYSINSDLEFVVELHTYLDSPAPATLQIKDLLIEET